MVSHKAVPVGINDTSAFIVSVRQGVVPREPGQRPHEAPMGSERGQPKARDEEARPERLLEMVSHKAVPVGINDTSAFPTFISAQHPFGCRSPFHTNVEAWDRSTPDKPLLDLMQSLLGSIDDVLCLIYRDITL